MTIDNEIKQNMEEFIITEIRKMITNEDFETLYSLEKIKYGKYHVNIKQNHILIHFNDCQFKFPYETETETEHHKSFFGFKYKKTSKIELTEIGKIQELYYKEQRKFETLKKNKDKLDALPENIKKDILRKRKFKEITERNINI